MSVGSDSMLASLVNDWTAVTWGPERAPRGDHADRSSRAMSSLPRQELGPAREPPNTATFCDGPREGRPSSY